MIVVIILIIFLQIILIVVYIPYHVSLFAAALYALWYCMDVGDFTGTRNWDWLRNLHCCCGQRKNYILPRSFAEKTIFVVSGDTDAWSLMRNVGMHGGAIPKTIYYLIPRTYMWIPVLRDILMWSGALTWSSKRSHVVLDMLNKNRYVCLPRDSEFDDIVHFAISHGARIALVLSTANGLQFGTTFDCSLYANSATELIMTITGALTLMNQSEEIL